MPPVLLLLIGATCISFAPIFVKMVEAAPAVSAWYRVFLGGHILLLWGLFSRSNRVPLSKAGSGAERSELAVKLKFRGQGRMWIFWCIASGLFFALDLAMWHQAIIYSGAGISTFLANLNVFYLTFFGILFLRERLSFRYGLFTFGALLGSLLLIDVTAWAAWSEHYARGIVLGFLTGMAYSGFILCLRQAETSARSLRLVRPLTLGFSSMATAAFLTLAILSSEASMIVTGKDLSILVALALIAQVLGWSLISRALPALPVSISGLLLLLQPVLAAIWAVLLFDEVWNYWQVFGAFLTLLCIYGGNLESQRRNHQQILNE